MALRLYDTISKLAKTMKRYLMSLFQALWWKIREGRKCHRPNPRRFGGSVTSGRVSSSFVKTLWETLKKARKVLWFCQNLNLFIQALFLWYQRNDGEYKTEMDQSKSNSNEWYRFYEKMEIHLSFSRVFWFWLNNSIYLFKLEKYPQDGSRFSIFKCDQYIRTDFIQLLFCSIKII